MGDVAEMRERKLTPRGEERRQQILDRAAHMFAENGYHSTSVADIVRECKVGKGVFYWYFESKEVLFTEIIRSNQLAIRKHQQRFISAQIHPLGKIESGIHASIQWMAENRHTFALFQFAANDALFAHLIADGSEVSVADTMRHVKDGITAGQIHDGDPLLITTAILGVLAALTRHFLFSGEAIAPEVIAQEATTFVLHGLATPEWQSRPYASS